jgi:hypothetical protein
MLFCAICLSTRACAAPAHVLFVSHMDVSVFKSLYGAAALHMYVSVFYCLCSNLICLTAAVRPISACASPGRICSTAFCAVPGGVWPTAVFAIPIDVAVTGACAAPVHGHLCQTRTYLTTKACAAPVCYCVFREHVYLSTKACAVYPVLHLHMGFVATLEHICLPEPVLHLHVYV